MIAGGQGKAQDFSALSTALTGTVKQLVLIGEAASEIGNADDLNEAINISRECADNIGKNHDGNINIILSPACSSFDMFADFEDRGEKFICAVEDLR